MPFKWLIQLINANLKNSTLDYRLEKPIETIEEFNNWDNTYTHSDGVFIFENALKDNVIIGAPIINECDYYKKHSIFD